MREGLGAPSERDGTHSDAWGVRKRGQTYVFGTGLVTVPPTGGADGADGLRCTVLYRYSYYTQYSAYRVRTVADAPTIAMTSCDTRPTAGQAWKTPSNQWPVASRESSRADARILF